MKKLPKYLFKKKAYNTGRTCYITSEEFGGTLYNFYTISGTGKANRNGASPKYFIELNELSLNEKKEKVMTSRKYTRIIAKIEKNKKKKGLILAERRHLEEALAELLDSNK